ncbi:MAG TPA: flagellar basal body rod protein FlgF [Novosphingobium sp.]
MDRLIYTAMSGMTDSMVRQRVIASNMANAQTVGFRAEMLYSTPVTLKGPSLEARAMTEGEVRGADMSAGSITQTGRPLDIALEGDALLAVQAQDGTEAYTRRGDLSISPTGVLQNGDGRPVIGASGPITLPLGADAMISNDGAVLVRDPAAPDAPPTEIDRLKLASPKGSQIMKDVDGLFRVSGGGVLPDDETAKVVSGALEQSNVKPTEIIVQMIEAQRLFDIRTKLISTARDVDESGASLMRL